MTPEHQRAAYDAECTAGLIGDGLQSGASAAHLLSLLAPVTDPETVLEVTLINDVTYRFHCPDARLARAIVDLIDSAPDHVSGDPPRFVVREFTATDGVRQVRGRNGENPYGR